MHSLLSCQDEFIKTVERSVETKETEKNKVTVGWYSRDDMSKVLHWTSKLGFCHGLIKQNKYIQ